MPLNSQSLDRILSAETTVSATITSNTAFTLPSAANMAGKLYTIYNPSASTANVLVNAADASLVVTVQPGSAAVVTPISDVPATNAAWMVVTNGVNASGVKGNVSGSAIAAGYVGEVISGTVTGSALTTSYVSYASVALTPGAWRIAFEVSLQPTTSATINSQVNANAQIFNSTDAVALAGTDRSAYARNVTALAVYTIQVVVGSVEVNISTAKTYQMRAKYTDVVGGNGATLLNQTDFGSRFYAVRIP